MTFSEGRSRKNDEKKYEKNVVVLHCDDDDDYISNVFIN